MRSATLALFFLSCLYALAQPCKTYKQFEAEGGVVLDSVKYPSALQKDSLKGPFPWPANQGFMTAWNKYITKFEKQVDKKFRLDPPCMVNFNIYFEASGKPAFALFNFFGPNTPDKNKTEEFRLLLEGFIKKHALKLDHPAKSGFRQSICTMIPFKTIKG